MMDSQFRRGNCVPPHIPQPACATEGFPADGIGRDLNRFLQPVTGQFGQTGSIDTDVDSYRLNPGTHFLSAVTVNHGTVPWDIDTHIVVLFGISLARRHWAGIHYRTDK